MDKARTAFEARCIRAGPLRSALLLGRAAPLRALRRALPARRFAPLGARPGSSTDSGAPRTSPCGIRGALHPRWTAALCVAPRASSSAARPSSRLAGPALRASRCSPGFIHGLRSPWTKPVRHSRRAASALDRCALRCSSGEQLRCAPFVAPCQPGASRLSVLARVHPRTPGAPWTKPPRLRVLRFRCRTRCESVTTTVASPTMASHIGTHGCCDRRPAGLSTPNRRRRAGVASRGVRRRCHRGPEGGRKDDHGPPGGGERSSDGPGSGGRRDHGRRSRTPAGGTRPSADRRVAGGAGDLEPRSAGG